MARSFQNVPLRPGYTLCRVDGEPAKWFRLVGRKGAHHSRVAEADVLSGKTVERGHLVTTSSVRDERVRGIALRVAGCSSSEAPGRQEC